MQQYEQYKDSGVDWLGEIPAHWENIPIKFAFNKRSQKNNPIRTEERLSLSIEKGVTLYADKTTNLDRFKDDFTQYQLAHPNDIVLNSMNMIVGAVGISHYFGCVSPVYYVIYPSGSHVNALFYSYLLNSRMIRSVYRSLGEGIYAIDRGDGRVNTCRLKVSYDDLGKIPIPLPPLAEQTAIANFLDTKCEQIDRAVAQKEKVVELLNERRQILIQRAVTRGLNPDVELRDSGIDWIGQIPAHWEVSFMKHLLSGIQDGTHGTYERVKSDYFLLSAKNISDSGVDISDNESSISEYDYLSITSNGYPKSGDVLLCCVGTIGRCCLYNLDTPIAFQRSVAFLRPNDNTRDKYLLYILRSESLQIQYQLYSRTSAQSGIYLGVIKNFRVPFPPLAEQTAIAEYLDNVNEKIDRAIALKREEIEKLKEYKQTLINSAVTGKIKIAKHHDI